MRGLKLLLTGLGIFLFSFGVSADEIDKTAYEKTALRIIDRIGVLKSEYPHFVDMDTQNKRGYSYMRWPDELDIVFNYKHGIKLVPNPHYNPRLLMSTELPVYDSKEGIDLTIYFFEKHAHTQRSIYSPDVIEIGKMKVYVYLTGKNLGNVYTRIIEYINDEKIAFEKGQQVNK